MSDGRLQVVIVDDDEVDREAVRRALRGLPVELRECQDAESALALLASEPQRPRVVLLDINMPGVSGLEFLDSLRADPALRSTVVFMLTSSSRDLDRDAAYQRGVAGYLVKGEQGARMAHLASLITVYATSVRLPG